jgi:hypothetical protein
MIDTGRMRKVMHEMAARKGDFTLSRYCAGQIP